MAKGIRPKQIQLAKNRKLAKSRNREHVQEKQSVPGLKIYANNTQHQSFKNISVLINAPRKALQIPLSKRKKRNNSKKSKKEKRMLFTNFNILPSKYYNVHRMLEHKMSNLCLQCISCKSKNIFTGV